jgi:XTP/dITP diphosphohydrolase
LDDSERSCRFICVIAYLRYADDPLPIICHGVWEGTVLRAPRGVRGFGYDPVFQAAGATKSAAELDPAHKHRISHRGLALAKFVAALRREP